MDGLLPMMGGTTVSVAIDSGSVDAADEEAVTGTTSRSFFSSSSEVSVISTRLSEASCC